MRALLAVGSSLAAAGGGRAWKAVLSAALTATGEAEPWYAGERHVLVLAQLGWVVRNGQRAGGQRPGITQSAAKLVCSTCPACNALPRRNPCKPNSR